MPGTLSTVQQICTLQLLVLAAAGSCSWWCSHPWKERKTAPLGVIHEKLMVPKLSFAVTLTRPLLQDSSVLQQVGPDPLLVDLPPVAWLQPPAFGNSLPSVVEWLPVPPHDLLLVSCYSPVVCSSLGQQRLRLPQSVTKNP